VSGGEDLRIPITQEQYDSLIANGFVVDETKFRLVSLKKR